MVFKKKIQLNRGFLNLRDKMKIDYAYFDGETIVRGELNTGDLVLEGSFEGQIDVKGNIMLKNTAVVDADLHARKLMIEEGAICNGHITLSNGEEL